MRPDFEGLFVTWNKGSLFCGSPLHFLCRSQYASPSSHNEEIIGYLYQAGFLMGVCLLNLRYLLGVINDPDFALELRRYYLGERCFPNNYVYYLISSKTERTWTTIPTACHSPFKISLFSPSYVDIPLQLIYS